MCNPAAASSVLCGASIISREQACFIYSNVVCKPHPNSVLIKTVHEYGKLVLKAYFVVIQTALFPFHCYSPFSCLLAPAHTLSVDAKDARRSKPGLMLHSTI